MFQYILFACSIFLVLKFTLLSIVWIVLQIAAMLKIIIWMMNANNVRLMISKFWNFGHYKLCIIKLVRMMLFFMSQQHYNNVLSCLSGLSILCTVAKFLNMFYSHIAFCCVSCKIASRTKKIWYKFKQLESVIWGAPGSTAQFSYFWVVFHLVQI